MDTNTTHTTKGIGAAIVSLLVVVALAVTGCATSASSTGSAEQETTASTRVEGPDTWTFVLVGRGTESTVDLATGSGTDDERQIDAANERVVRAATDRVKEYLDKAWLRPAANASVSPDSIGWAWIPTLGDGADTDFWANGPSATALPKTEEEEAALWRGDLRTMLWRYTTDSSNSMNRWITRYTIHYSKASVFTGVGPDQTDNRAWAIVQRAADGALKNIYVRWAVEVGISVPTSDWKGVMFVGGFARLGPDQSGNDGELVIVDPAIRVAPAELPMMSTNGYFRMHKMQSGEPFGASTPWFVGDGWYVER